MKSKCAGGFSTVVFEIDSESSIDYHGRFLKLKSLNSPYLAQYVEFTRLACDPYKVALTCEHPKGTPLSLIFSELTNDQKRDIGFHLLSAMDVLHKSGIPVGYLSPQNVIVDRIGKSCFIRLIHYGTFYLLGESAFTNVFNIFTLTPENIMKVPGTQKQKDLFSLGILLRSIQMGFDLHADYSLSRYCQTISSVLLEAPEPWKDFTLGDHLDILFPMKLIYGQADIPEMDPVLEKVVRFLLTLDPMERPEIGHLISFFDEKPYVPPVSEEFPPEIQLHLWKLCGKSIERNLLDSKFIYVSSSLVMMVHGYISRYLKHYGIDQSHAKKDYRIFVQPDKNFQSSKSEAKEYLAQKNMNRYRSGCSEMDTNQRNAISSNRFLRFVALYDDKSKAKKLLRSDIPNSVRCLLWSQKLTMKNTASYLFNVCNNPLAVSCKHQLSLDLPRCHQYDEAMTLPSIQAKITLIIEKILAVNPEFSAYWQGLDSLVAPFALLYANNVEDGFTAAFQLVDKFTPDYFTRHSSHALEESLKLFSKLIFFHHCNLANFLRENGLSPSTFAVPWLLTCYAHVFPFSKLFNIFDEMLNRASFYPLCIGLAILELSSTELMDALRGDEAFKILGNVSDLDVSVLLKTSDKIYESIPCSCFFRKHAEKHWEMSEFKLQYSFEELENLLVPKIAPEDYYSYFLKNEAILVVSGGNSADPRIISVEKTPSEVDEKTLKQANLDGKLIGVIGDDHMKVINLANILAEKSINKVCVLDSTWVLFQFNHDL
ncbi:hypothetical protein FO519_007695 [Halicephalobus sp. NKZ332]|nr:hypothetical protein FO519_007695 [Halicephalobus sp. NKZ332]